MFRGYVGFQEGSPQRKQGGIQCRDEVVKTYGHPALFGSQTQTGTIFCVFSPASKLSILFIFVYTKNNFFIILLLYTFKVLKTVAIYIYRSEYVYII